MRGCRKGGGKAMKRKQKGSNNHKSEQKGAEWQQKVFKSDKKWSQRTPKGSQKLPKGPTSEPEGSQREPKGDQSASKNRSLEKVVKTFEKSHENGSNVKSGKCHLLSDSSDFCTFRKTDQENYKKS